MLHQPVLDYPDHLVLKLRIGVLTQLLKVAALTQRTGSHILARNICVAAWMINPVLPTEALTQNRGILIQRLS